MSSVADLRDSFAPITVQFPLKPRLPLIVAGGSLTLAANLSLIPSVRSSVRRKYPRLSAALLAALPLEVINFWVVGYPAAPHPVSRLSQAPGVALQWYLLHLGGIIAADRSHYIRQHSALVSIVLFIAGYIATVVALLVILWFAGLARRVLRKLSSPVKQAA